MKQKAFFIIFKGLPIAKNYLRPESDPFRDKSLDKLWNEGASAISSYDHLKTTKKIAALFTVTHTA